ncbi:hypothetical protein PI87_08840 [Ralstonia sp. A12]|uniref:hypothetical protein n=1 Tax=Ralstonia sp. A12 TaxID=1217052 RepID=UPI00057501CC|nr:hypothetical protein [Ralstonia sp. A12]KHK57316.1 hypothetical protein PI87_08840 [Ralstonia sp. A12]
MSHEGAGPATQQAAGEHSISKTIVTRTRLSIEFDDEAKVIRISTPGGQRITLDDTARSVTLQDVSNNQVTLAPEGITLRSSGNVTIQAGGALKLDAVQGVSVRAQGSDVSIGGMNITAQAEVALKATSNMTAELSGGATTTVRGGMVMIN